MRVGRASASPIIDLFITLLSMGRSGYEKLRKERIGLMTDHFLPMLHRVAEKNGERVKK